MERRRHHALCPCDVPVHEVDAHNVVPAWEASDKQEYAARTIRRKINGRLDEFLTEFPTREAFAAAAAEAANAPGAEAMPPPPPVDWDAHLAEASAKGSAVRRCGGKVARKSREKGGARGTSRFRRDESPREVVRETERPERGGRSVWSIAVPALRTVGGAAGGVGGVQDAARPRIRTTPWFRFWRSCWCAAELSDNFCAHNPHYDSLLGASGWARRRWTRTPRTNAKFAYTREQFERAETHDELWNAAQMEMTALGSMHGFLRMYWAKKILEWTPEGPARALETAIYLNDKYQLDGRDPNGYVGCMWAVAGVHDQGWKERPSSGR